MTKSIRKHPILLASALALGLLVSTCAVNPVTGNREVMLMSEQQEIALGKEADPAIIAQYGLYPSDKLQNFINQKGQQMAKVSHRPDLKFTFRVLDSPVVNAFALPGGYVYFTRGILAHFNNEAQFAGVLGHEIGHVTARHGAKQQTRSVLGQTGLLAGTVAGTILTGSDLSPYAQQASQGLGLLFLKFGRDDESQSDRLGVEYSTKIGYDANEMAKFFETLHRLSGGGAQSIPTFMSTHPDPLDRNQKVDQMAEEWQAKVQGKQFAVNRDQYLSMIEGIVYGEDPRQGYTEGNTFYHPELKFQFDVPAGWQLYNSPSVVQIAEPEGKALIEFMLGQGGSAKEAAKATIAKYGFTVVNEGPQNINGLDAYQAEATYADEQSQANYGICLTAIKYGDLVYQYMGITDGESYATYANPFKQSAGTFKALSDPARLNKQPEVVRVVSVSGNTTLRNALLKNGIPQERLKELAVLNGMNLSDNLGSGTKIKVVSTRSGNP